MPKRNPVSKTLRALNWLVECSPPQVGVRQLAEALGIAPSSAHRILLALSEAGYVRQDARTQRYSLGNEFFRVSQLAAAKAPLRQASLAAMLRLVETCKEPTLLCIYDQIRQEVNYTAALNSNGRAGQTIELNKWLPIRTGASGLAILAYLKEAEVQSIARRQNFHHRNGDLAEPTQLRSQLDSVRSKGYAFTRCQWVDGASGLAAPIFDGGDKVMGAICVTLPRERAESDKMDRLIDAMLHCANDVTKKMNGSSRSVPLD